MLTAAAWTGLDPLVHAEDDSPAVVLSDSGLCFIAGPGASF